MLMTQIYFYLSITFFFVSHALYYMLFQIQLGPSEFLLKVSGTFGQFSSDVITSLTLVTNFATYGPFGRGGGTPFRTSAAQRNGRSSSIVGFFARAGQRLDAIGVVYTTNPEQQADNVIIWLLIRILSFLYLICICNF